MGLLCYNPMGFTNTGCFIAFPENSREKVEKIIADLDSPHVYILSGTTPRNRIAVSWEDRGHLDGYWYDNQYGVGVVA